MINIQKLLFVLGVLVLQTENVQVPSEMLFARSSEVTVFTLAYSGILVNSESSKKGYMGYDDWKEVLKYIQNNFPYVVVSKDSVGKSTFNNDISIVELGLPGRLIGRKIVLTTQQTVLHYL